MVRERYRTVTMKKIKQSPYLEVVRLRSIIHNVHLEVDLVERELEKLTSCLAPSKREKPGKTRSSG